MGYGDDAPISIGSVVDGRWRIISTLGDGAAGQVFRVRDDNGVIPGDLALKLFRAGADTQRFDRERMIMERAKGHPHIVQLHDYGMADGHRYYLVMELANGGPLSAHVRDDGGEGHAKQLEPDQALWIAAQCGSGLAGLGTIHRDVKPENFLVFMAGTQRRPAFIVGDVRQGSVIKVADMGLAKDPVGMSMTMTGHVMGTPEYMSPEQCSNSKHVTPASDVYALGVMLYEMSVGQIPFPMLGDDQFMNVMNKHRYETVFLPATIDQRCADIILIALAKDPASRYQTPAEFANACRDALRLQPDVDQAPIEPQPDTPPSTGLLGGVIKGVTDFFGRKRH